ncbi:amidohydrolase family protein [Flavitalea flava]
MNMPVTSMKVTPIDPLESPSYGLNGRIVTMRSADDIIDNGIVYISKGKIIAVLKEGDPVPPEMKELPVYKTKCTIFPGLIELHNHLSYNCLPLWNVPKTYGDRSKWAGIDEYKQLISGPMKALGKTPGYVEAIVRYVECKCLVAGVTTSQGVMLFSNSGIRKYYRGIVRNVEDTQDHELPRVDAHIPDIAAKDATHFLAHLKKTSCLLLHLSEGTNALAHKAFESLKIDEDNWAITEALTGIHCVALQAEDYEIMKEKGASMIWSPLSNLLLYGKTAEIKAAKDSGITIGLGSDWSPSGSKNLFGELKVAKLYSAANGNIFSDYELICLATKNPAKIIRWDKLLGTVEKGKLADLLLIEGVTKDPYQLLLNAAENKINLVVINGTPRFGTIPLMQKFGVSTEQRKIGGADRLLNLSQDTEDPVVSQLTLAAAESKLKKGLKNLKDIGKNLPPLKAITGPANAKFFVPEEKKKLVQKPQWYLVLDHDEGEGESVRPHLPGDPPSTAEPLASAKFAAKLSPKKDLPVLPIRLDPLTVADDKQFFKLLKGQLNLPDIMKDGLEKMYK